MENFYKRMIYDCPIAYVCVKANKDGFGEYSSVKSIEMNDSFKILFNVKQNELIEWELADLYVDEYNISWRQALKIAKKSDKYISKRYISKTNLYYSVEVYYIENDTFAFRFMEIDNRQADLTSIIDSSAFRVWIKDRNGKYLDVNKKLLEDLNITYEQVIGKNDIEIFGEEYGKRFMLQDVEVMHNNKMCTREEKSTLYKNREECHQVTKWTYMDKNNNIIGTVGIGIDITDKEKLKKNIRTNEENFLEIAKHIEDVIIIRDKEKAIYVSPSWASLIGESPSKFINDANSWPEYFNKEDIEKLKPFTIEEKYNGILRPKNNNDKWLWCKFKPIKNEYGEVIKSVGIISDFTKKMELEMELDNLRLDFFTNLSHELRTPINIILSCLQILNLRLDKLDYENYEYYNKYLKMISQNGLRLLKLVNNLIDSTKIDRGFISYNPQNYDLVRFIEDICFSVSEFIKSNNLTIIFDTDIEEKIISFDLDHMERIILNLISNAIKFNKPNGSIVVSISCKDKIYISVKDSGIGIPKDKIDKIFGRFEQVGSKTKKEKEGSGIGLSLVKSLVEIHNGCISVKSREGEGSEFIIALPNLIFEEKNTNIQFDNKTLNNVSKMNVEFSDIYI